DTLRRDGGLLTGGDVDLKRCPAALGDTIRLGGNVAKHRLHLGDVEVTELKGQVDLPGDDVHGTRNRDNTPHGPDLIPGGRGYDSIRRQDEFGGGQKRVLPCVHRRGPGVICHSHDGYVPSVDRHDAGHHSDVLGPHFQNGPLLDVVLDEGGDVARRATG